MTTLIHHDPRFTFGWYFHDPAGTCDLKVYRTPARLIIAVFSDLVKPNGDSASQGTSITNAIEFCATKVRAEIGIVPDVWVEFYPDRGYALEVSKARGWRPQFEENFAYVTFAMWRDGMYRSPQWTHVTRAEVEALIGQPFDYEYCNEDVL